MSVAAAGVACLVLFTALAGGFVAGLDAGFVYNTFPLMDGEAVPSDLFTATPWWRAFFEDVIHPREPFQGRLADIVSGDSEDRRGVLRFRRAGSRMADKDV